MTQKITLLVPDAPVPAVAGGKKLRELSRSGIRFGTLDNSKSNADHLLGMIVDGIKAELPVASVVLRKPSRAAGADAKLLDQLAEEADCVISAMAD